VAVALLNRSEADTVVTTSAAQAGAPAAGGYTLLDLWAKTTTTTAGAVSAAVPAHGVVLYRISPDR
jgi:alpha-galactosidase